jgi:hypothetical protein
MSLKTEQSKETKKESDNTALICNRQICIGDDIALK